MYKSNRDPKPDQTGLEPTVLVETGLVLDFNLLEPVSTYPILNFRRGTTRPSELNLYTYQTKKKKEKILRKMKTLKYLI